MESEAVMSTDKEELMGAAQDLVSCIRELVEERDALKARLAKRVPLTDDVMLTVVKAYIAAGKRGLDLMGALKCAVEASDEIIQPAGEKES